MFKRATLFFLCLLIMIGCTKKTEPIHAPYFEVKGLDGKVYTLNDYKGKPLLLVFWATWCPTCKKEIAKIAENYQKLKDAGLQILLVSMDRDPETVKRVAQKHGFAELPIAIISNQMSVDYQGVRFLPTGMLIDPKGIIRYRFVGELPPDEILKKVKEITKVQH